MMINEKGFEIIEGVYTQREVNDILEIIEQKELPNQFGVRAFLVHHPEISERVFTKKLKNIIHQIAPNCTTSIKSIYFNKPPSANWIVNWHQDLTINLQTRKDVPNFKNWRKKDGRVIVQPDRQLLESIFTIRIHLDDCTRENGALRVIEHSHRQGVIEIKEWVKNKLGKEHICEVQKGGILLMKPLLLHSSKRTENQKNRRVIHIEFIDQLLPDGLEWLEKVEFADY